MEVGLQLPPRCSKEGDWLTVVWAMGKALDTILNMAFQPRFSRAHPRSVTKLVASTNLDWLWRPAQVRRCLIWYSSVLNTFNANTCIRNGDVYLSVFIIQIHFFFPSEKITKIPACSQRNRIPTSEENKARSGWLWISESYRERCLWRGLWCVLWGFRNYFLDLTCWTNSIFLTEKGKISSNDWFHRW